MAIWKYRTRSRSECAGKWRALVTITALVALCCLLAFWRANRADEITGGSASRGAPWTVENNPKFSESEDALPGPPSTDSSTLGADTEGASVSGEAAKEQLRKSGQYESLGAAFQAARYAVDKIDPSGPHSRGADYFAANPAQQLRAWFSKDGIELASGRRPKDENAEPWSVALRLRNVGRDDTFEPVSANASTCKDARVEMSDPATAITQWFENKKDGIEQGFTLAARPAGAASEVALLLSVEGNLRADATDGRDSVRFVDSRGAEVLHWTSLKAWDAHQRELSARIEVRDSQVVLLIADTGAHYPITVDPLFVNVEARLNEYTGAFSDFGFSIALSGNTALVGALDEDTQFGRNAGTVYVFVRNGTAWSQQQKLTAGDGTTDAFFGSALALLGNTAAIGARGDDTTGPQNSGSAYVFIRNGTTWSQQAKLSASDGMASDTFGHAVALSANTALVGAPGPGYYPWPYSGRAYVFVRNGTTWSQQAKLIAADGAASDRFGVSVALSGETALVGAENAENSAGVEAGAAYVFVRSGTTWTQQTRLTSGIEGGSDDNFGGAVALSGNTALVGAYYADSPNDISAGAAYVFVRTGTLWTRQTKLFASDGSRYKIFGTAVALDGDTALVGMPDFYRISEGAAYLFVRSGTVWSQRSKLTASDRQNGDNFGRSVALSGDTVLVGAPYASTSAADGAGSAYVYVQSGTFWYEQEKLMATDGSGSGDAFASEVALSGNTALIGASYDDTPAGADAGRAYVFVRNNKTWTQQEKLASGNAAAGDYFGLSVALNGDTAAISGYISGVYIYKRNGATWGQRTRLVTSDGAPLGEQVALNGDTALVGRIGTDSISSAAVFVRNGLAWTQQATLIALNGSPSPGSTVDSSLALDGDTAIVAGFFNTSNGPVENVSVFVRNGSNWSQQAKLTPNDKDPNNPFLDFFGGSVAVSGDTALIGAPEGVTPAAYVFTRVGNNWSQQAKLIVNDVTEAVRFGWSVSLEGNTALIGAPESDAPTGSRAGNAYVYVRNGTVWNQSAKLTSGVDVSDGDNFGWGVALSGDTALVGAYNDGDGGSAYVFLLGEFPNITAQPVSRTVVPGQSVTFQVTATGYAPLRFQWRKDGSEIAGANGPSFSIPSASAADAGSYDVVISNVGGIVTSAAAMLSVNSLSEFAHVFPAASADAHGFILVNLSPAGIGAGWRFVGEQQWRTSGVPVGGMATGDREIEFRPVSNYYQPLRETVSVISGGAATVLDREYFQASGETTGALSVTLKPESLAAPTVPVADRAQWRFLGEDNTHWHDSGAINPGLSAGIYLVECKPLPGRTTPPPLSVSVPAGQTSTATTTYFLADAPIGTQPGVLPFETVSTSQTLPYAYVGQLRSDAGASTGFVVKARVVATAGHVVFDDGTLSAATGLQWLFQRDRGTYEPKPQIPRGFYIFDGYSAQRTVENTPGQSSPQSQTLDAAALYFLEDAGRGGFGGFLASDATDNEWLLSPVLKTLVGYPVDGVAPTSQGRMHATPPTNVSFARAFGRTFTTAAITSSGGNSGGPLCVQFEGGNYYPAAIYLGGTAQTVVRVIDSGVIDLFNRAVVSGNGGGNNTGGGIIHVSASQGAQTFGLGAVKVNVGPVNALAGEGGWRFVGEAAFRNAATYTVNLAPGTYTVEFNPVSGFGTPPNQQVQLTNGVTFTITGTYASSNAPGVSGVSAVTAVKGSPFTYAITATNTPTAYSFDGTLPNGLIFNAGAGTITGAPAQSGSFVLTLHASNGFGTGSKPLTINVPPRITNAGTPLPYVRDVAFQFPITTGGDAIDAFGADGLPPGIAVNASGVVFGAAIQSGVFEVTLRASNAGGTSTKAVTLKVAPAIKNASTFEVLSQLQVFTYAIDTGGDSIGTYGLTGTLPGGLVFSPATGIITGMPGQSGVFDMVLSATNAGGTATHPLQIKVLPQPTSDPSIVGGEGTLFPPYTVKVKSTDGTPTFDLVGTLPAGLVFDATTGKLTGVATESGVFSVTINVTNAAGTTALALTITINPLFYFTLNGPGAVTPRPQSALDYPPQTPFALVAKAEAGAYFAGWTGDLPSDETTLAFVLDHTRQVQANFQAFAVATGTYTGFVQDTPATTGRIVLTLDASGAFTGAVKIGKQRTPLQGIFGADGNAAVTVPAGTLRLHLGLSTVGGVLDAGATKGEVLLVRPSFSGTTNPAPQAGYYTLAFAPDLTQSATPQGSGYGIAIVKSNGKVRFAGTLADGTAVTQSAALSPDGTWAFFVPLNGSTGSLSGTLSFHDDPQFAFVDGTLAWFKPDTSTPLYPAAFAATVAVEGSAFLENPALPANALITFNGGGISIPGPLTVPRSGAKKYAAANFALKCDRATGLLTGGFTAPGEAQSRALGGVFLPRQQRGAGFFRGTQKQTVGFTLVPAP